MQNDNKQQMKMILAAVAVVVALGVAIWSGVRSMTPQTHIVGSLGGDPQGSPTPAAQDNMSSGKAAAVKGQ